MISVARCRGGQPVVLLHPGFADSRISDLLHALVLVDAATPEALAHPLQQWRPTPVEVNLRAWVGGPHRTPERVDPELRARFAAMQRHVGYVTILAGGGWG